jgi:hypothetical protein
MPVFTDLIAIADYLAEGTMRFPRGAFPSNMLPVRGLIRSRMMIYAAAGMVNLRCLHRDFTGMAQGAYQRVCSSLFPVKAAFAAIWTAFVAIFRIIWLFVTRRGLRD